MLMNTSAIPHAPIAPRWRLAVVSAVLGWILDAFDFFVIVFLFDVLAAHFGVPKRQIVITLTFTLAARPVGALIFGSLADRFGRRIPLIFCVAYFSLASLASVFAPSYFWFAVLRTLYGVGMGGYWGIASSYAMESTPPRRRGMFSGILQTGYSAGYLLAALAMFFLAPRLGWRSPFFASQAVAVVVIVLTTFSPESHAWQQQARVTVSRMFVLIAREWKVFLYLLAAMTGMICLSHGTQDLYPDFLRSMPAIASRQIFGMGVVFAIPILYNIGSIIASPMFGEVSERIGRRGSVLCALALCLMAMHWWAFGTSVAALAIGAFFMQAGVQGALGIVPAHLTELSPPEIRTLFPGFVYQLGVLCASPGVLLEYRLRSRVGYSWALTIFELGVIFTMALLFYFGPERRGRSFLHEA
jgi:SHS family lactate transporter-like MFS transporter